MINVNQATEERLSFCLNLLPCLLNDSLSEVLGKSWFKLIRISRPYIHIPSISQKLLNFVSDVSPNILSPLGEINQTQMIQ